MKKNTLPTDKRPSHLVDVVRESLGALFYVD